jgi:hypothetical protein
MSYVHVNNGANTAIRNVIRTLNTCFAISMHKPKCNENNQNHCYGMQTPIKLAWVILQWAFTNFCGVKTDFPPTVNNKNCKREGMEAGNMKCHPTFCAVSTDCVTSS